MCVLLSKSSRKPLLIEMRFPGARDILKSAPSPRPPPPQNFWCWVAPSGRFIFSVVGTNSFFMIRCGDFRHGSWYETVDPRRGPRN